MSEQRMSEVGVTAGVLKVVAAVEAATAGKPGNGKPEGNNKKGGGKRAAAAADDSRQPKLSKFFGRK